MTKKFPLCLAPMVGLSHAVLRQVIREYMPKNAITTWPTEMLNSRRVPNEIIGRNSETLVLPEETNLVPQLLGNEEKAIRDSIDRLSILWSLKGIDINMGCPVQKALKHNYGVALLGDFEYAKNVVAMAARSTKPSNLKLSVKLRAVNSTKTSQELVHLVAGLVSAGADQITLHPRTAEQQRRGKADWDQIKFLNDRIDCEIVGNGDIEIADDVFHMMSETGISKVMSGRAMTARPWLVWQVGERLGYEKPERFKEQKVPITEIEEGAEYGRMLLRFIELVEQIFCQKIAMSESLALRKIQFFVRTNHVWLQFGHTLMSQVHSSRSLTECSDLVGEFFMNDQVMMAKTELRQ